MRRSVVVAAVLLVVAFVFVGGPSLLFAPSTEVIAPENSSDPSSEIVRPTDGESGFWPYLNSRRSFEKRSPINVVVIGDSSTVLRLLTGAGDTEWSETDEEFEEAGPQTHLDASLNSTDPDERANESVDNVSEYLGGTTIQWGPTTGATRYAYVVPGDGSENRWVTETAQLHDGSYYGQRYHVRIYESPSPDDRWVAMQTHSEHFDWFTLRHRVHGTQRAQIHLESDLMALPQVDQKEDVSRVYLGNANAADADGWATFVELAGVILVGASLGRSLTERAYDGVVRKIGARLTETNRRQIDTVREHVDSRHVLLAVTILVIVMGVRIGGITMERTGLFSMHAIAAVLYPFVALGLPIVVYLIASDLDRRIDAAVVASGTLSVAIWLDYGLLGVRSLPIDVVVQRMFVVVALGLIAGGAARRATRDSRWNGMIITGAVSWSLVLVGTLFGYL